MKLWLLNVKSKIINLINNLYEKKEVSEKIILIFKVYIILMLLIYLCFLYISVCFVWILFGLDSLIVKLIYGNNLKFE